MLSEKNEKKKMHAHTATITCWGQRKEEDEGVEETCLSSTPL